MILNKQGRVFKGSGQAGFTLIELMVVLVILGILAVTIAPQILDRPERARRVKAIMTIETLGTALDLYKLDMGRYPTTAQGLQALISRPEAGGAVDKWREGGYLRQSSIPRDPWGNDFIYLSPGVHGEYDIISYGADGAPGGQGIDADIKSWELGLE